MATDTNVEITYMFYCAGFSTVNIYLICCLLLSAIFYLYVHCFNSAISIMCFVLNIYCHAYPCSANPFPTTHTHM